MKVSLRLNQKFAGKGLAVQVPLSNTTQGQEGDLMNTAKFYLDVNNNAILVTQRIILLYDKTNLITISMLSAQHSSTRGQPRQSGVQS